MATIQKMHICGLRSFGPNEDDMQTVKFSSPLTLFLGENGCGKTTIIESLKFACSGDIPSGCKNGHGFVNDPKLSGRASTKGQVRLKFTDVKGNRYVTVKSVQLSMGAVTRFKRLDTVLQRINQNNTTTDLSSRCANIDDAICDILGVSKPILNYVLFCHQEDAAWPLDEGKKLKDRFDEIFGATNYNKCAEIMRKLVKEKQNSNKVLHEKVIVLKSTANAVDKMRIEMSEKEDKVATFGATIEIKKDDLAPIDLRLQKICDLQNNLAKLQEVCTKKETLQRSFITQQIEILKSLTEEYSGSDEELQKAISLFENDKEKFELEREELEKKKKTVENNKNDILKEINKLQVKIGKLQAEKKAHENVFAERTNLIKSIASKLQSSQISTGSEDEIKNSIEAIDDMIKNLRESLQEVIKNCDSEEDRMQKEINECSNKLARVKTELDSKNRQKSDLKAKTRDINSQLRELDYSDEKLKTLKAKISQADSSLKSYQDSFNVDSTTKTINESKIKIRQNEEELEILEQEHKVLQQNAIRESELESLNDRVVKRQREVDQIINKHYDNYTKIFGEKFPEHGNFKNSVNTEKERNQRLVERLNKEIKIKQRNLTTVETKSKIKKDDITKVEKELVGYQEKVFRVCKNKPYEEVYEELNTTVEKLQNEKGLYSSAKVMYGKFIKDFQSQKPCCPVCKTDFAKNQSALETIVAEIQTKLKAIPDNLSKIENQLKESQDKFNNLLQVKPIYEQVQNISGDVLPRLKTEYNEMDVTSAASAVELDELMSQIESPQAVVDSCSLVIGDSALVDQNSREINQSKEKVSDLQSQIATVPSNRTRQQAEVEIENLKADLTNLRQSCESSQKRLQQHNDRCQELRETRNKFHEQQLQLEKAMQGKAQLHEQLSEFSIKEKTLNEETEELQSQLGPLKDELNQIEKNKNQLKIKNRKLLEDERNKLNQNEKCYENIKKLNNQVKAYITSDGDGQFERTLQEINKYKEEITGCDETIKKISSLISEANRRIISQESAFRNLKDNVSLREKRRHETILSQEIADVKKQIGEHNHRSILEEKDNLQKSKSAIIREIDTLTGRSDELKARIKQLKKEMSTPESKEAHVKYKKQLIQYECSKKVVEDLLTYTTVLEKAILQFHKERMDQINKIIRQLWRSIYRGNDCDYIEIQTNETKNVGTRRTYDYKVVQIKNNVEIEMRGRCSAGQKVLACLIIRMALAETFSRTCGIFALDEPTTNLDRSNISSLGDALGRLINTRQTEKNFQLLIITHDEEFINTLSRVVDKIDSFWRVSRNNKGNSVLTRELL